MFNGGNIIKKSLILLLVLVSVFVTFSLSGYFLAGTCGFIIVLALVSCILLVLTIFADKACAALSLSSLIPSENKVLNILQNSCALSGVKNFQLYCTRDYGECFHFVKSLRGQMAIFISPNVLETLSKDDWIFLVRLIIKLDKDGVVLYRSFLSSLFIFFEWPLLMTSYAFIKKYSLFVTIANFYFFPIYLLKRWLMGGVLSDYLLKNVELCLDERIYLESILSRLDRICKKVLLPSYSVVSMTEFLTLMACKRETFFWKLIGFESPRVGDIADGPQ